MTIKTETLVCPNCFTEHFSDYNINENDKRVFKGKCQGCNAEIKFKTISSLEKIKNERESISFTINGTTYYVDNSYPISMTLNEYLRNVLNMTGTKVMCREGGCGSCIINAEVIDQETKTPKTIGINTCLFPLYSCDKYNFTTIEAVGSKAKGFHPIQEEIAKRNGSQCGWCTTGMVMNMRSLLLNNPKPEEQEVEDAFDGNICRCTGYRAILDAMKHFSKNPLDIEELNKLKCVSKDVKGNCSSKFNKKVHITQDNKEWYAPETMNDLFALLNKYANTSTPYKIVSGNTGVGIFKNEGPFDVYIDIKKISELENITKTSTDLVANALVSITKLGELFKKYSSDKNFKYLQALANHIPKVGNTSIRNVSSWSGNLAMKNTNKDFASDLFLLFEAVDAVITLVGPTSSSPRSLVSPLELLNVPLRGKLIYSIAFPALDDDTTIVKTYKVMLRSQNSRAYVNAAFRVKINPITYVATSVPSLVFGGISGTFNHATRTERYLFGKALNDQTVLQGALNILSSELAPTPGAVLSSVEYRKSLGLSLFYKFILHVNSKNIDNKLKSALDTLVEVRGVSKGVQDFGTEIDKFPLTEPIPKLNAILQASGEAAYVLDQPFAKNELHGALILSTVGNCRIDQIDITEASSLPGVVEFIFAKDLPGPNIQIPEDTDFGEETLFAADFIDYAGQPIGMVVAETPIQATNAAKAVKITYKERKKPILTIEQAIDAKSFHPKPSPDIVIGDPEVAYNNAPRKLEGSCEIDTQFHFYMENQVAVCRPTEDGVDMEASTQNIALVQHAIATALNLDVSAVSVKVKQVGGGYGAKIRTSNLSAVSAAVACKKLNRPVRVAIDLNSSLEALGKRNPWYIKYRVGLDNDGKLLSLIVDTYVDDGYLPFIEIIVWLKGNIDNTYKCDNWRIIYNRVKTNTAWNTFVRSPGTFSAISLCESMMDHIAHSVNKDPLDIRMLNLYKPTDPNPFDNNRPFYDYKVDKIIADLIIDADYRKRSDDILKFNSENRWKKKGMSLIPLKWSVNWAGSYFNANVSIYSHDGSIVLLHGGVEIGQGISTKLAQILAYELREFGVKLNMITVRGSDSLISPNCQTTGGAVTTETVSIPLIETCKKIRDNLRPIAEKLAPGYAWRELVSRAFTDNVDLSSRTWSFPEDEIIYYVYGAACSEAIYDVLTGEYQILRTDIVYDCGESANPLIDIGQAEGAFMMGLGNWLYEKIRYDPDTGRVLTNGTWDYKPPTSKDIPVDFRVKFLKNSYNSNGVLGSKCVGEAPLCLSACTALAVKHAIQAARADIGRNDFFTLNAPLTAEDAHLFSLVDYRQFGLN